MRLPAMLTTAGCLLALAGTSRAAQIASPTIFGAFFQQVAQCTIGNVGKTPVSVTVNIVDEQGNVVSTNSHCGIIEPNFLCQVSALSISTDAALACTATTPGSAAKLRGNFALLAGGLPIRSAELR